MNINKQKNNVTLAWLIYWFMFLLVYFAYYIKNFNGSMLNYIMISCIAIFMAIPCLITIIAFLINLLIKKTLNFKIYNTIAIVGILFAYIFGLCFININILVFYIVPCILLTLLMDKHNLTIILSIVCFTLAILINGIKLKLGYYQLSNYTYNLLFLVTLYFTSIFLSVISKNVNRYKMEEIDKSINTVHQNIKKLDENLNKNTEENLHMTDGIKQISEAIEGVNKSLSIQTNSTFDLKNVINNIKLDTDKINDIVNNFKIEIGKNLDNFSDVDNKSNDVKSLSNDMINYMNDLKDKVNNVSESINLIKKVSDDIHLLSLNASIEASHAGESGKGFSVIADNIRKLVSETVTVTNTIYELLDDFSNSFDKLSESISLTKDNVEIQSNLVDNVNKSFTDTVKSFDELKQSILDLHDSIDNSVNSINKINDETQLIHGQCEEISAISENVLTSSENLSNNMENINKMGIDICEYVSNMSNIEE